MRKSLSVIGSFCLGIGLSIAVLACADDNQHSTSSPEIHISDCIPTILSCFKNNGYNSLYDYSFYYDDNGRLIRLERYSPNDDVEETDYDISYSGATINILGHDSRGGTRTITITVSEEDIDNVHAYNLAVLLQLL